jgi:hypothetical protein
MERFKLWFDGLPIRDTAGTVLDALKRFALYIGVSLKDALARKTTWVAIVCTALLFLWGGYWLGADKKREAYDAMNAAIDRMKAIAAAQKTTWDELAMANARVKSLENELEELRKSASTTPAPAPPKARPARKPAAAAAPAAAPATGWSWLR